MVFVGVLLLVEINVYTSLSIKQSELSSISAHYQTERSHIVDCQNVFSFPAESKRDNVTDYSVL